MKIIAVVGATGYGWWGYVTGFSRRNFVSDADDLILVASERSVGKEISLTENTYSSRIATAVAMQPDIIPLEVKHH
jgi:aspartate-semialdehyde dehydrogenase